MAQRRMFSLQIVDSDAFLEMPTSSQLLYFHLSMRADDDGFVDNPKKIMRMVSTGEDDLKVLIAKRFLITFETGVVVIKHWKIHNYIQSDRYKGTAYVEEKKALTTKENGAYTECIQNVSKMDTQVRLGKVRLGEDRLIESSRFAPPSLEEVRKYCEERMNQVNAQQFIDFYSSKGWLIGKNKMKDWRAAVRTWENRGEKQTRQILDLNELTK